MRPSTDRRRSAGTSLIEALAATAFLSAVLLGLSSSTLNLTRTMKTSDSVDAATALAQEQLELLRSMPLGAAQLASGAYADPNNPLSADGTRGGSMVRSWTVSAPDTPAFGLKTVTVSVGWTDSRSHRVAVAAYVRCSTVPCS